MKFFIVLPFLLYLINLSLAFPGAEDEIRSLPGLKEAPKFRHYAGYLNAFEGRYLFYWFLESQENPKSDPIVQWIAGGPGGSSISSMFFGLGPWKATDNGKKLVDNEWSWNKFANTLFIDSPVGVGFSYENDSDYIHEDNTTAKDMHLALKSFFKKFPHYKTNNFYLTGVSYAGIYVPFLAREIIRSNKNESGDKINLKGVSIGNGAVNGESRHIVTHLYYKYHYGMIDHKTWTNLNVVCGCGVYQKLNSFCDFVASKSQACKDALSQIFAEMYSPSYAYAKNKFNITYDIMKAINSTPPLINAYNIYKPKLKSCPPPDNVTNFKEQIDQMTFVEEYLQSSRVSSGQESCHDSYSFFAFLSDPAVKRQLHARGPFKSFNMTADCFGPYKKGCPYKVYDELMEDHFREIAESGQLKDVILYFGNWDIVCDYISGQWMLESLGYRQVEGYKKWLYQNTTVGFSKKYAKGLTYVLVRGAGHSVNHDQPQLNIEITKHLIGKANIF